MREFILVMRRCFVSKRIRSSIFRCFRGLKKVLVRSIWLLLILGSLVLRFWVKMKVWERLGMRSKIVYLIIPFMWRLMIMMKMRKIKCRSSIRWKVRILFLWMLTGRNWMSLTRVPLITFRIILVNPFPQMTIVFKVPNKIIIIMI